MENNPKISILTPTVRPAGLALVAKALRRQSFCDFEWIITSPDDIGTPALLPENFAIYMTDPPKQQGDYWSLNKAYNAMLRQAKGDLIVSWQDYTYAKPDALQKFWDHYALDHKKVVSGVGNKYQDEEFTVVTWQDPRQRSDQGSFYPCYFADIEWNFCAIPIKALYAIGGFDEKLDKYGGMDGYSVVDRLNLLNEQHGAGWDFYLDQTNVSFSLDHDRLPGWDERNAIGGPYQERRSAYLENPKLPFLQ